MTVGHGSGGATTQRLAALPGDGVGPEVTRAALRVLEVAADVHGLALEVEERPVGWAAVQETGEPLPPETLEACRAADAVFLGAVGHPDAETVEPRRRPEAALLALRSELECYINLRPLKVLGGLEEASPLRPERVRGVDFIIVRELAGGLYYGEPRGMTGAGDERAAHNTLAYSSREIERVAEAAFRIAAGRRGQVTSVDKANVLETSRLWREVVGRVAERHPEVTHESILVDRAAMELVTAPERFDVILTGNLFGDILSDEAAGVAGSLGLLPSASLGNGTPLFEPVHGSAPELAGEDRANPVAAILSGALLLEHGLGAPEAGRTIEGAVEEVLREGLRTPDLARTQGRTIGTTGFADAVVERVRTQEAATVAERTDTRGTP